MNCSWNDTFLAFYLLMYSIILSGYCDIIGPNNPLYCTIGQDAIFMWSTDDKKPIYSASFGVKRRSNQEEDTQIANINTYTNTLYFNSIVSYRYRSRVDFVGNFTLGHAWFTLKNVSLEDSKDYFAVIRDKSGVDTYTARLKVQSKSKAEKEPDRSPVKETDKNQNTTQGLIPFNKTTDETKTPGIQAAKNKSTGKPLGGYCIIAFTVILHFFFVVLISILI